MLPLAFRYSFSKTDRIASSIGVSGIRSLAITCPHLSIFVFNPIKYLQQSKLYCRYCQLVNYWLDIMHCNSLLIMKMHQDKLKAMFPHASAATLKRNPEFAANHNSSSMPIDIANSFPVPRPHSKYGNVKVEYEGMRFDSKKELRCWQDLKHREKIGEIEGLNRQVGFALEVSGKYIGKFTADFTWSENDKCVVADCKSPVTRKETAYRLRKKIFEALYAPLVIQEL